MRDAASQLEFLKEVGTAGVGSLGPPDLLYLQGLLAWKQGQDLFQVRPLMVSSRCIHSQTISCGKGYSTFAGLSQGFCACVLTAHTLAVKCLQCIKSHLVFRPHQLEGHDILPLSLLSQLDLLCKELVCTCV